MSTINAPLFLNKKELNDIIGGDVKTIGVRAEKMGIPLLKKGTSYFYLTEFKKILRQIEKKRLSDGAVIVFGNHKGGVAKTTSSIIVSTILAYYGYKVLMIDMDIQSNLSDFYDKNGMSDNIVTKLVDISKEKEFNKNVINIKNDMFNNGKLDLISNDISIHKQYNNFNKKYLDILLKEYRKEYDFIILDTPPNIADITPQCLEVSDYAFMMLKPDFSSNSGGINFLDLIDKYDIELIGGAITNTDKRVVADLINIEQITNIFNEIGSKICDTHISYSSIYNDVPLEGKKSILELKPTHTATRQYFDITNFILNKIINKEE